MYRVYDYLSLHGPELPSYTRTHIQEFLHDNSASIVPLAPYSVKHNDRYKTVVMDRSTLVPNAKLDRVEVAVYRIQLWYRSIVAVDNALKNGLIVVSRRRVKLMLRAVVLSELRLRYIYRLNKLETLMNDMRVFIYEVLEESLTWCIRKEAAVARVIEYEQTSLNNSMIGQVGNLITNTSSDLYGVLSDSAMSIQSGINKLGSQYSNNTSNNNSPMIADDNPKPVERKTLHATVFSLFTKKKT